MSVSASTEGLDPSLIGAFEQFRADSVAQFVVALRRFRAAELRTLLSDPAAIDLETFNREVWAYCTSASCDGEDVSGIMRHYRIPAERVSELDQYLRNGTLRLHGNFIWGSGSKVFAPMLGADSADRTSFVRQATEILNSDQSPRQKVASILEIQGFGNNIATGLVMVFHPDEFAIWNTPSASAVRKLGYDANTLDDFQATVTDLRAKLGANDFLELDYFLYLIEQGDTSVQIVEPVWWVNQGTMHAAERKGGYIFAPLQSVNNRTVRHYANLALMKPGQTTLHYSGQALRAIGTVKQAAVEATRPDAKPGEEEDRKGNLVRVSYRDITPPIPFSEIPTDWITDNDEVFNRNGGIKEGYAFQISQKFLSRLREKFADRFGEDGKPVGATPRVVKIAPGEGACYWDDCLKHGYICVGWGKVGDLRKFPSKEVFREAFAEHFGELYNNHGPTVSKKANDLWKLRELKPGDVVVANKGISHVLAVGEVLDPPYDYQPNPDREEFAHLIRVRWDTSVAKDIPKQGFWALTTVAEVPPDLYAFIIGDERIEPTPPELEEYTEPSFSIIRDKIAAAKLRISDRTLRRYHLSLKTRGFVILCGLSGSGKTWLAELYAKIIGAETQLIAVAPNWTTNEDLIGYFNPMDGKYHDTSFSTFLRRASDHYEEAKAAGAVARPFHLILDEMNLARVEYYFAKFLSAMEQRARTTEASIDLGAHSQIRLPPNLYFIGTVNIDETTHGFADKVYDRAQLIEVDVQRQAMSDHLGSAPYASILLEIWDIVGEITPFAFRVLDELKSYVAEADQMGVPWKDAIDEQLLQKVLTKVKGADQRVQTALEQLLLKIDGTFPLTHAKAQRMLDTLRQHGITSYF